MDEKQSDDRRLYVQSIDAWDVHLKTDSDKIYCFSKHPDEDHYHRLSYGEIFVQRDHEQYCIECAIRHGFLTNNRLFWKRR